MNVLKTTQQDRCDPLCEVSEGQLCAVAALEGSKVLCRQLREMGVRERASLRIVRRGRNYVCLVGGMRIALSCQYVSCIFVNREI